MAHTKKTTIKDETDVWEYAKDKLNERFECKKSNIYIHGIIRTTKHFEPRYAAQSRVYDYVIPAYMFDPNFILSQKINKIPYYGIKINKVKQNQAFKDTVGNVSQTQQLQQVSYLQKRNFCLFCFIFFLIVVYLL